MAYVTPGTVAAGDVATAAAWNVITNDILQFAPFVQGVFTTEAVRDAAITSPTEGMHAYLTAATVPAATGESTGVPTGVQTIYNGSVWVCVTDVSAFQSTTGTKAASSSVPGALTGGGTNSTVTLVTGTTAFVSYSAESTGTIQARRGLGVAVSGATTRSSLVPLKMLHFPANAGTQTFLTATVIVTGLTAGTNVFTLEYANEDGTATFGNRFLSARGIA